MQIRLGALSGDAMKFRTGPHAKGAESASTRPALGTDFYLSNLLARARLRKKPAIWEISSAHALTQLDIPACIKTRRACWVRAGDEII